ncbi:MAG: beta-propeller domain-containing protein, partial [Myxococcota bacterium]
MKNRLHATFLLCFTSTALAAGCSGDDANEPTPGVAQASLTRATSCEDLEHMIKADALAQMNKRIDSLIAAWDSRGWGYDEGGPLASDDSEGAAGSGGAVGSTGGSGGGSGNAPSEQASEYSGTNTQVDGVDEADIVKTDGKYIYLLHGETFLVLNAWPSSELAQLSSFGIEGTPAEMYVTDEGKVVVYSTVDGTDIYEAAGVTPRDAYDDYHGYYGGGWAEPAYPDGYPGYHAHPLTKVTVLQLQDAQPTVLSEFYFEGTYASSRRVGQHVRTVVQGSGYGPELEYWIDAYPDTKSAWIAAHEQLRAANTQKIMQTTLADWLPYYMIRTGSSIQANLARCDEFYVPTAGSTTFGITQIQSIDLASPERVPHGASIIGATDTVYSSHDTFVLASQAWVDPAVWQQAMWGDDSVGAPSTGSLGTRRSGVSTPISTAYTHVHTFDLLADPERPQYTASGTVAGTLLNQFSLDVHNGHLRMATTDTRVNTDWDDSQVNHVFVLAPQGERLEVVGSVRDLAPSERIYSARFMGDKGYLVTFRQVDPLFVLDLKNPTAPKVLGELKIPGFSEYMHPLGDDHLLTIGQDGNLAVQVFDVSDPLNPVQKHKYVFDEQDMYGYSEAQTNHKAFTYYASHGLLAFPFVGWGSYDGSMRSSLELFRIDTEQGIFRLGSIDHSSLFGSVDPYGGYCGGYYGTEVRRGLFMEDFVYSISYGGVVVNQVDDLANP